MLFFPSFSRACSRVGGVASLVGEWRKKCVCALPREIVPDTLIAGLSRFNASAHPGGFGDMTAAWRNTFEGGGRRRVNPNLALLTFFVCANVVSTQVGRSVNRSVGRSRRCGMEWRRTDGVRRNEANCNKTVAGSASNRLLR